MVNIAFWNTAQSRKKDPEQKCLKRINALISRMIQEYDLDILALCEYPFDASHLLTIDLVRDRQFDEAKSVVQRIDTRIFYSKKTVSCSPSGRFICDENFHCMNRFQSEGLEFSLHCIHLPSKLHAQEDNRRLIAGMIVNDIREQEQSLDKRTLIVGDFNSEPYELTMIGIDGFHALPDRVKSAKGRTLMAKKYDAFYNPMWNLYGDFIKPVGTYYYDNNNVRNQYWYLLDQVIMRSEMTRYFVPESLRIIESALGETLVSKEGRPNVSDHLPFVFSLR